eukprot:6198178-Pleurochrysis_carterae.AAC.2
MRHAVLPKAHLSRRSAHGMSLTETMFRPECYIWGDLAGAARTEKRVLLEDGHRLDRAARGTAQVRARPRRRPARMRDARAPVACTRVRA